MTTALDSVVVDESTQAAAEATDPGPTEHIMAWSQEADPTEVVTYVPRRSWKLPLLCAALATGAVVGGAIFAWPHHAPTPAPTTTHQVPTVPTQALSPDAVFLKNLHDSGFPVYDQMSAITAGRYACQEIKDGHLPIAQVEKEFIASTNGYFTPMQGFEFIGAALNAYCPKG